jgi:hypothetical protein
LFFSKVENTDEFKKFFPIQGEEKSMPEEIMGTSDDKRKKSKLEK